MKKLLLPLSVFSLLFFSCESEEINQIEEASSLQTFEVLRQQSGDVQLNYNLANNISSDLTSNAKTGENIIDIFPSNTNSVKSYDETFHVVNNNVNFIFNMVAEGKKETLSISDATGSSNAKTSEHPYLKDYKISKRMDRTYQLDFTVKSGVRVNIVFNDETGENEIHLNSDSDYSNSQSFTTDLTRDGKYIRFAFFNNFDNLKKTQNKGKDPECIISTEGTDE